MQVLYLGRAPRTNEILPDFLKWRQVTRSPLVFRGLTGSQRTPGFWGVTALQFPCSGTKIGASCLKIRKWSYVLEIINEFSLRHYKCTGYTSSKN